MIAKDKNMVFTCNAKALNSLLIGVPKLELVKVMNCATTKVIWDKMSSCYEGESKVNWAKIQGFRMLFEPFNMHDDEDIEKYFLRVDEAVNTIRGPDEKLE